MGLLQITDSWKFSSVQDFSLLNVLVHICKGKANVGLQENGNGKFELLKENAKYCQSRISSPTWRVYQ